MLHYEKLPKKTPSSVVLGILVIGMCLSYSIVVCGLIVFYAVIGIFSNYFYPGSTIAISGKEAAYLGGILLVAAVTGVMLSFLAYYMNTLSKLTYHLSRIMWVPTLITTAVVYWQHQSSVFTYHISSLAVVAVTAIVPLGGVLPALFLSTKTARKVHNR